jgi:DNA-binding NarL/FixJ family response regulator
MDVQIGAMSGLDAARALLSVQQAARVLMLTASRSGSLQQRAAESGACGLVFKSGDPNEVPTAVPYLPSSGETSQQGTGAPCRA